MPDMVLPGPVERANSPKDSVHIHTRKIFDACRDKDCVEDLRVYPTVSSQALIGSAISVRPNSATLLSTEVNVEPISFNRGYYTVDVTYFYRITGTTFPGSSEITGLAVFDKRVLLFGSESAVKTFSSRQEKVVSQNYDPPTAIVEAVDPIALNMKLVDPRQGPCQETDTPIIPEYILEVIGEELVLRSPGRQLFVTLGQFSIIRLERPSLLTLSDVDRYFPAQECVGSSEDDPCTMFSRVSFPVDEFLPPDQIQERHSYKDLV